MISTPGTFFKPYFFFDLLWACLVATLFWQWLHPLAELTDTHSLPIFQLFFVCVLLFNILALPWYLQFVLNLGLIFYLVHYIYVPDAPFFSLVWLGEWLEKIEYSLLLLISWELGQIPFEVKTWLFLVSIWYVAAYLYQFRYRRMSMLTFLMTTIIYLAILDTFTPYQGKKGIVLTLLCSFLLLAALQQVRISSGLGRTASKPFHRLADAFGQKAGLGSAWLWLLGSASMVGMAIMIGFAAPKAAPKWPDPIGFIQAHSGVALPGQGSIVQKVGYGEHDDILGGGFVQDDSIAFYAITNVRQYWRGESKDIYTGRGWEKSTPEELYYMAPQDDPLYLAGHPGRLFSANVATERVQAKVFFTERHFSNLFYQGDLALLQIYPKDSYLQLDPISARFTAWEDEQFSARKQIEEYVLESTYPTFSIRSLQEAKTEDIPEDILRRYTQLPEQLPTRIGALAQELTVSLDNQYDRVKEIERYFRMNGYRYETTDVPVPGPDQDYVDQFIFETKRGYCDNFSTAMVVMLRTIGIPARWVKGFTAGEIIEQNDGNYYIQVLNKHAHSWVEVYFPHVGWVPFEPTQSFVNPYEFERDHEHDESSSSFAEQEWENRDAQALRGDWLEDLNTDEPLSEQASGFSFQHGQTLKWNVHLIIWIASLLFLIVCLLLYWRRAILLWLISRYRKSQHKASLKSYELLISTLGVLALRRKPSQTLREYIFSLEEQLASDWPAFVQQYEQMRYGRRNTGKKEDS